MEAVSDRIQASNEDNISPELKRLVPMILPRKEAWSFDMELHLSSGACSVEGVISHEVQRVSVSV